MREELEKFFFDDESNDEEQESEQEEVPAGKKGKSKGKGKRAPKASAKPKAKAKQSKALAKTSQTLALTVPPMFIPLPKLSVPKRGGVVSLLYAKRRSPATSSTECDLAAQSVDTAAIGLDNAATQPQETNQAPDVEFAQTCFYCNVPESDDTGAFSCVSKKRNMMIL